MNIEQISQGLLNKLDHSRLVIWQDIDAEFVEQLDHLALNGAQLIAIDTIAHLAVKQRVELTEPTRRFVLYTNKQPNEPTRDWLFDIRQYATHFYADSSAMILNELNMRMEFRQIIGNYKLFFANDTRKAQLKKHLPDDANKAELEMALIGVALNIDSPTFLTILQYLVNELADKFDVPDTAEHGLLAPLAKFNLLDPFWSLVKNELGYFVEVDDLEQTAKPTIKQLVVKLLFTDCYHALHNGGVTEQHPALTQCVQHLLPILTREQALTSQAAMRNRLNTAKGATAISFVNQWRDSRSFAQSYNTIANIIEIEHDLKLTLSKINQPQQLALLHTFEFAERHLMILLAKQLTTIEQREVNSIVSRRLHGYWCVNQTNYQRILKAIKAAKLFYSLKHRYIDGFNFASANDLYQAYQSELYLFDASYRTFCLNAYEVAQKGADILKATELVADIEALYVDWYLHDLAITWGKLVDNENLLENWHLPDVPNQYDFYQHTVVKTQRRYQVKRMFVIVSDALRYEVAHQLNNQINDDGRFKAELSSQLGVVPSYTQLGMAALLPHEQLTAHINNGIEYKADGQSVHGLDNRHKILQKHQGMAFQAADVLGWTNQQSREKLADAKVVYIYHDEIDITGDTAGSEHKTFAACDKTVKEIRQLVERIITKFNNPRVVVTADHGFLFKTSDLVDADRAALTTKPAGVVVDNKRYLIGENLPKGETFWQGKMRNTANLSPSASDAEFIVPRGSNRFHFVGGAKFIHGGIMPQEICVPIINVRQLKTASAKKQAKQSVNVVPLITPLKLVSLTEKVSFLQTTPINDEFKARKLAIWIADSQGQVVSNIQQLSCDSTSDKVEDCKHDIIVSLTGVGFDRTIDYKLILKDLVTNEQYATYPVTIDLAIEDDFF